MSDSPSPSVPTSVDARIAEIEARANAATAGPWAWASTCEKGYGANVGAGVFAEGDEDCTHPLTGDLSTRTDDYYVDQGVAEMSHQQANADADFIAHAREDIPFLIAALRAPATAPSEPEYCGCGFRGGGQHFCAKHAPRSPREPSVTPMVGKDDTVSEVKPSHYTATTAPTETAAEPSVTDEDVERARKFWEDGVDESFNSCLRRVLEDYASRQRVNCAEDAERLDLLDDTCRRIDIRFSESQQVCRWQIDVEGDYPAGSRPSVREAIDKKLREPLAAASRRAGVTEGALRPPREAEHGESPPSSLAARRSPTGGKE